MREHEECEREMQQAARTGQNGWAEYVAARCDRAHGRLDDMTTTTDTEETK